MSAVTPSTSRRTILVTGATGYIGSHLVRSLHEAASVAVLVRDRAAAEESFADARVEIYEIGSTSLVEIFEQVDPDIVFHLATQYERNDPSDVSAMVKANFSFGVEVLDAASRMDNCDVVLVGSHFQTPGGGRQPANLYAATKEALLTVARYLTEVRGLRCTQVVLYDVYGPRDPRDKLIPRVSAALKLGEEIRIPDPEPLHHFVYIDDVVNGLVTAAENMADSSAESPESVFLTSDAAIPPSTVVSVASEVLGVEARLSSDPYVPPHHTIMIPTDGPRPDGWAPRITLAEGISRTAGEA